MDPLDLIVGILIVLVIAGFINALSDNDSAWYDDDEEF
jgi:hypothetical protein